MKDIVSILKALSDETRLRIINILFERELCVCDIVDALDIIQTKASRHLQYLKNAGLVKDRKQAQWVYYSMTTCLDIKFLDSLIYDKIRQLEPFKSDLKNLEICLERKKSCNAIN
ncbi:MAG: metalloregulator ArsR/SmtB family transcription factor [Desulfobacterales bacterium]|nr:metalloregulator ArsR/SmtB family transcription factor [Desulfobacterales bacterium]